MRLAPVPGGITATDDETSALNSRLRVLPCLLRYPLALRKNEDAGRSRGDLRDWVGAGRYRTDAACAACGMYRAGRFCGESGKGRTGWRNNREKKQTHNGFWMGFDREDAGFDHPVRCGAPLAPTGVVPLLPELKAAFQNICDITPEVSEMFGECFRKLGNKNWEVGTHAFAGEGCISKYLRYYACCAAGARRAGAFFGH